MIDRLRQMAIFAKVIDHGSFRGAARELRLSPSVVSHHVSELEAHIGVALLYRSTRRLSLTKEGEALLAAARKMVDAAESELAALSMAAREPAGELSLTAPSVLSPSPFTDAIAAFSLAYPRIRLSVDFSDHRRELIEGGFDIAIRMGFNAKTTATSRVLFRVERKLFASTDYLASRSPVANPRELQDWDWLALSQVQNPPLSFNKRGAGFETIKPKARIFANDAQAIYRLARAGAGLAVAPVYLAEDDIVTGRVADVLPDWELQPLDVFAAWPANAPRHGLSRLILDALSQDTLAA